MDISKLLFNPSDYKDKPLSMGCLNPIASKQDDGTFKFYPCRHCVACQLRKMFNLTSSAVYEILSSAGVWFVTLTYRNRDIPRAWFHFNSDTLQIDFCDDNGVILSSERYSKEFYKHLKKISYNYAKRFPNYFRFGQVPFLCRSHVTKYLKRVRIASSRQGFDSLEYPIRYLLCGEYGESFARPHFHLLLFFKSRDQYNSIEKIFTEKWDFGNVDARRFTGTGASYLSSYSVGLSHQHYYYGKSFAKQFVGHSIRLGFEGYEKVSKRGQKFGFFERFFNPSEYVLDGREFSAFPPYNYKSSLLRSPRCSDMSVDWFSVKGNFSAVSPNKGYERLKLTFYRWYSYLGNTSDITRYILSHKDSPYYFLFGSKSLELNYKNAFNRVYYDVYNSYLFCKLSDESYSGNDVKLFLDYQVFLSKKFIIHYCNNELKYNYLLSTDSASAARLYSNKPLSYLDSDWFGSEAFQSWSDYITKVASQYDKSKKLKHKYTLKDYE